LTRSLKEGLKLWNKLGDTPIDDDENIDTDFKDIDGTVLFEKGTFREEIWHWFEETFEDFSVAKAMYGENA